MYIGDLLGDTMHLTPAEFGAYHWIMYHQWRNGPIPERSLRAVSRLSREEWEESEDTLKAFLSVDESGCYYQKRTQQEKEKSDKLSTISRENGLKGGRPKNPDKTQSITHTKPSGYPGDNPEHNPEGTQSVTPSPSPSHSYAPSPEPNTLALPPVGERAVFDLPLPGKQGEWGVPQALYREMVVCHPGVEVMTELGKMRGWLVANPSRRKTARGLPAFISNWLSKAQNTGGSHAENNTKSDANYAAFQQVMGTPQGPQTIDSRSLDNPRGDTERRSQQANHSGGIHRGADAGEPSAVHPGVQPRARNVQVLPESGRAARLLFPA